MKLLAVAGDIDATIAVIRLVRPLQALVGNGNGHGGAYTLRLRSLHQCASTDLGWADVLILQRPITERAWRLQQRMQASGGTVLLDLDDLLTEPPPTLRQHVALTAGQGWLRAALAAADGVAVSTPRLAQALAPWARVIHEVPNHGLPGPAAAPRPREGRWPTLLLASSDHAPVAEVAEALGVLQQGGGAPRVVAVGPVAADLAAADVQVEAVAPRPRPEFLGWVQSLPGVVALVPVGDTRFDACKSAIKYFDFALCGVPVLASARPPYSDVLVDGKTGWLVPDRAAEWQAALLRARDEPLALDAIADAARRHVASQFTLAHTVAAWARLLATVQARLEHRSPSGWRRWIEPVTLRLRAANRARLARRAARKAGEA